MPNEDRGSFVFYSTGGNIVRNSCRGSGSAPEQSIKGMKFTWTFIYVVRFSTIYFATSIKPHVESSSSSVRILSDVSKRASATHPQLSVMAGRPARSPSCPKKNFTTSAASAVVAGFFRSVRV